MVNGWEILCNMFQEFNKKRGGHDETTAATLKCKKKEKRKKKAICKAQMTVEMQVFRDNNKSSYGSECGPCLV